MKEPKIFISSDKRLDLIVKSLKLNITVDEHDRLVYELYNHIDHTRTESFRNGYDQGKFDEKMDRY